MERVYGMTSEIGVELIARSKAVALGERIDRSAGKITLDFEGVVFMSRSFADELCNIADELGDRISYVNMEQGVEEMVTIVAQGRKKERERGISNARFLRFHDVDSLAEFIAENC